MEDQECCGSGCTNCVLDQKYKVSFPKGYQNILNGQYIKFRLVNIEMCTPNVFEFTFESLKDKVEQSLVKLVIPGGSHLMLRAPKETCNTKTNPLFNNFKLKSKTKQNKQSDDKVKLRVIEKHDKTEEDNFISRPYTPVRVDSDNLKFSTLIKLEPYGKMSVHLQCLQINDITEWKGPYSKVPDQFTSYSHILFFCHGVSIAPVYTLSKELLSNEDNESMVHVYACFQDIRNVLLRDNLKQLNGYWNFKSTIFLSREASHQPSCLNINEQNYRLNCECIANQIQHSEQIVCGRLNEDITRMIIKDLKNRGDGNGKNLLLICGSQDFIDSIKNWLLKYICSTTDEIHIL